MFLLCYRCNGFVAIVYPGGFSCGYLLLSPIRVLLLVLVNMDSPARIKICGITSVADARIVGAVGADALGLVFYEKSPRNVSISQARQIALSASPFLSVVGLFVNAGPDFIESVLKTVPLGLLQFHGNETEAECSRWGVRYIKAFRVQPEIPVADMVAPYHSASGYLLDSYRPGIPGGTGEAFDWQLIPKNLEKPVILAGGLDAHNIADAINQVKPYAVDVSSGVESQPGKKDHDKIKAFVSSVRR